MLLNSTLKLGSLGYLEGFDQEEGRQSTLKLERPDSRNQKSRPNLSRSLSKERASSQGRDGRGSRDFQKRAMSRDSDRIDKRAMSRDSDRMDKGMGLRPLEWTHAPRKDVRKEGPVVYSVSTPAKEGPRDHALHLVRTTRIEPATGYSKRPPVPPKRPGAEQIVVTEKDLKKCGSDLKKLRECNLAKALEEKPEPRPERPPSPLRPLELSFKSNFAQMCREGADLRDPWKDLAHPDEGRNLTVEDLVLNQVYVKALSPRKLEFDETNSPEHGPRKSKMRRSASASTRASSADVALQEGRAEGREVTMRPRTESQWFTKRAASLGRERDRFSAAIQPVDLDTPRSRKEDETPQARREARTFLKGASRRGETRAVWMTLNQATGEVTPYQKEAGNRLEAAFLSGRSSVPLAGLGPQLEGAIVTFDKASEQDARVRWVDGTYSEVKRFQVTAYSYETTIQLAGSSAEGWRFARNEARVEERLVPLFGTELIAPPSPKLPPVTRDRQVYFINAGADWGGWE
ncbi:unnamed protein product [Effrenium voratum]|nr:unnamed protein product [Effrenium voratum]